MRVLRSHTNISNDFEFKDPPSKRKQEENIGDDQEVILSKYFKKIKQEVKSENNDEILTSSLYQEVTDTEWVKTLKNKEYFDWLMRRTGNIPNRWNVPLDDDAFIPQPGHHLPKYFKQVYLKLRHLRSLIEAPVDSVGGSSIPFTVGKQCGIDKESIDPKNYRVQVLIGVMLSSQTKDEMTAKAMFNIMKYCIDELKSNQGLTVSAINQIDESTLDELIKSVGFHQRKAKFIKQTCTILAANYNCDIPTTDQELLALPGVGPKMTYLTLQKAWGKLDGICVDVHVDRFCKLFNWVDPKKCKTPNLTRIELESWLPTKLWREINVLLVGMGQLIDRGEANRVSLCSILEDEDAIDVIEHMKNYNDWVKYILKGVRNEENISTIKDEFVQLESVPQDIKLEGPSIKLENENEDAFNGILAKLNDTKNMQIKTE